MAFSPSATRQILSRNLRNLVASPLSEHPATACTDGTSSDGGLDEHAPPLLELPASLRIHLCRNLLGWSLNERRPTMKPGGGGGTTCR